MFYIIWIVSTKEDSKTWSALISDCFVSIYIARVRKNNLFINCKFWTFRKSCQFAELLWRQETNVWIMLKQAYLLLEISNFA
jgi:hypothetical protein